MQLANDKIERLIFIKFLLSQAEKQKEFGRPTSSTTILTLHDLVECFLQLGLEHLTAKSKPTGNNILDFYSKELNNFLSGKTLSQISKPYIKRLNELRNQLKHTTIFIDKKNIENLYLETEIFIKDFTPIFFNIGFNEISILQLITYDNIRNYLSDAEKMLLNKEYHYAIIYVGKAFYEYKQLAFDINGRLGHKLRRLSGHANYTRQSQHSLGSTGLGPSITSIVTDIAKDINELAKEVIRLRELQLLSVDMREYSDFEYIMPQMHKLQAPLPNPILGEFQVYRFESMTKNSYSYDQVR